MTGNENVEIAIPIHIDGGQVVAALVGTDHVFYEFTIPFILIPCSHPVGFLTASNCGEMSVAVNVGHSETVRKLDFGIDLDLFEVRASKPKYAFAVTARRHVIGVPVAVEIGGHNVCRSFFVFSQQKW